MMDISGHQSREHKAGCGDEAADIMNGAARRRGRPPKGSVLTMSISRKKILEKIAGKQKGIDYHLDDHIPELIGKADKELVEYEVRIGDDYDK